MKKMSHFFLKTTEGKFLGSVGAVLIVLLGYYFYAAPSSSTTKTEDIVIKQTDHVRGAKNPF
jgi:hypothetical protein